MLWSTEAGWALGNKGREAGQGFISLQGDTVSLLRLLNCIP